MTTTASPWRTVQVHITQDVDGYHVVEERRLDLSDDFSCYDYDTFTNWNEAMHFADRIAKRAGCVVTHYLPTEDDQP